MLETLRSDKRLGEWLRELEAGESPQIEVRLPDAAQLPAVLLDLAIPHEDINELVALRPQFAEDAELRWLFERIVRSFAAHVGTAGPWRPRVPTLPKSWGAVGRWFYVYVFVALLPYTAEFHRSRGIPEEISRHTLADIGRNVAVHRRRRGVGGMLVPWWPLLHLRGELYQLGRLQYQRTTLGERTGRSVANGTLSELRDRNRSASGRSVTDGRPPLGPGSPTLGLHIPDFCGPLSPQACDRSLELARAFFARHFPEESYSVASCHSWLLDPQLRSYLPADSNIVRFQDRFTLAYSSPEVGDKETISFVFGDPDVSLDQLPRHTTLQRAVVDHLRSGGHWHTGHGWFAL